MSNSPPKSGGSEATVKESVAEDRKCPICLEEIEQATSTNVCPHVFCHECIRQWLSQRNQCPLCRAVIGRLRHKVIPKTGGSPVDTYEEVNTPLDQAGYVRNLGHVTILQTPLESSVYQVTPLQCPDSQRVQYSVVEHLPDRIYLLTDLPPGTLWILPSYLPAIRAAFESYGITEIEPGTHRPLPRRHRHALFLNNHPNHQRSDSGMA